jgi:hypothetical protein
MGTLTHGPYKDLRLKLCCRNCELSTHGRRIVQLPNVKIVVLLPEPFTECCNGNSGRYGAKQRKLFWGMRMLLSAKYMPLETLAEAALMRQIG